jgi:hypothetical protein
MVVAGALGTHRPLAEPWKQWLEPLLDIGVKSVSRFPNSYMSNEREGVQKILTRFGLLRAQTALDEATAFLLSTSAEARNPR